MVIKLDGYIQEKTPSSLQFQRKIPRLGGLKGYQLKPQFNNKSQV